MTTTTRTTTSASRAAGPQTDDTTSLSVRPVSDQTEVASWAEYVERSAGGSLFHHPDWSHSVTEVFGHRPLHRMAWRGTQTVGILPLLEVNSLLGGRLLVSVPYGNYGGILCDDEQSRAALAQEAVRLAEERGARVLDLRSAEASVPDFESVEGYLGFVRGLPLHPNEMETFLPRKARAAARHARERDGVVIQHDPKLARTVWHLYCRSMRRLGSVNYPYKLFVRLFERLGERAWATVAWLGERPVTGTISFVFGDTVMPYIVGADERIGCEGATNLLYWSVMERGVRSGLRRFDFGRSRADNRGPVSFKKNQGFKPQPLGYQRFVPAGRKPPNLKPSNPRFALVRRVWPRLPLPLTRRLGTWLAKSIPG